MNPPTAIRHLNSTEFHREAVITLTRFITTRRDDIPFRDRSRIYTALHLALSQHCPAEAEAAKATAQAYIEAEAAQMTFDDVIHGADYP